MNKTFKQLTKGFTYLNSNITEQNFPIPENISIDGYKIIKMDRSYSSKEAMERIEKEGCRAGTIWELALLQQEHPELWPKGAWSSIAAFGTDYIDSDGDRRVPRVSADTDGGFRFGLGRFERGWIAVDCLLCVCDNKPSDALTLTGTHSLDPLTDEQMIKNL